MLITFIRFRRRRLHGRRGLKFTQVTQAQGDMCRRLHGRRGLKCPPVKNCFRRPRSPPSRAAWIEITTLTLKLQCLRSPPSRAAWIEISTIPTTHTINSRRLHGRRGLKLFFLFAGGGNGCRRLHGRRGLKCVGIYFAPPCAVVAAFTGGVDLNSTCDLFHRFLISRRLHGRRGLK